jgi:DNA-binding MarR family transcriptional regulator
MFNLGPVRHGAVALRVGTQPSRVSKEVRTLVAGGLVSESPDPDDRRAVLLRTTEKGAESLLRYLHAAQDTLGEVLADWSDTDLELFALMISRLAEYFAREPRDR